MKKKSLFLGGALMFAMTFSTTVFTSCHDDDKKYEEVEEEVKQPTTLQVPLPMPTVHWQEPP